MFHYVSKDADTKSEMYDYMGCFQEGERAFGASQGKDYTVGQCLNLCRGKKFMAIQDTDECYCADSIPENAPPHEKVWNAGRS